MIEVESLKPFISDSICSIDQDIMTELVRPIYTFD
jgi:hypothetical protein